VRDALNVVQNAWTGSGTVGDMAFVPSVLGNWLRAKGVQPEPGQRSIFGGRNSLRSMEARLAELDVQRAEAMTRIDAELATPVEAPKVAAT
jgi:hypothetical protein